MAGLSFSAAYRWMNCIGSTQMCKQLSRLPQTPLALEGTQAHAVAAGLLEGKALTSTAGIAADKLDEMVANGRRYVELVKSLTTSYNCSGNTHVEKRWTHSGGAVKNYKIQGDADVIVDGGDVLLVGDYKYGKGTPVSAERNYQLMITAVTRLNGMGWNLTRLYKGAVLFIHQPRSLFGDTFSSWFAPLDELLAFEKLAMEAARQSNSPDAQLTPGDWCRQCDAKVLCPKFVEDNLSPIVETPPLTAYTLQQVGPLLSKAKAIKAWIEDTEAYVKHALLQGYAVPGWKLSTRSGTKVWRDTVMADVELEKLLGEKRHKHTLLSPAQVLEKYGELAEALGPYIDQPKINALLRG
jgi:hypothetical protein